MKFVAVLLAASSLVALPAHAQTTSPASFDGAAARTRIDAALDARYRGLEQVYRDIHSHPEVAFQETRTASLLADRMRALGFEVTEKVGKTGVVALYRNGPGPVVLVRTELDGLPMEEKTGLAYASRARQVVDGAETFTAQACGHDIHMAWWVGTAEALLAMKESWHGTLMFVAQPAEETISGARAMLEDGLFTRFPRPDYGFAAHVGPEPEGEVIVKQGVMSSASDSLEVTFHGVGAHGSMPDKGIDPIMQAGHFITGVQTVISRQKDPKQFGVVSIGAIHAGTVSNIIPDHADLLLTLRSFDPEVRADLREGVANAARAAAMLEKAPEPEIRHLHGTGSVINDPALSEQAAGLLTRALGADKVKLEPASAPGGSASEDYAEFVDAGIAHSVYFGIGGTPAETIAKYAAQGKPVPVNHSPYFAPAPEPAIRTGVETLALAVLMVAGTAP